MFGFLIYIKTICCDVMQVVNISLGSAMFTYICYIHTQASVNVTSFPDHVFKVLSLQSLLTKNFAMIKMQIKITLFLFSRTTMKIRDNLLSFFVSSLVLMCMTLVISNICMSVFIYASCVCNV